MKRLYLRIRIWWLGLRLAAVDNAYVEASQAAQALANKSAGIESEWIRLRGLLQS